MIIPWVDCFANAGGRGKLALNRTQGNKGRLLRPSPPLMLVIVSVYFVVAVGLIVVAFPKGYFAHRGVISKADYPAGAAREV